MSEIINGKLHFEVSTIETIDQSVLNFVESLSLSTMTNKGFKPVPVIWGTAERSFQAKGNKEVRDSQGLLVLPIEFNSSCLLSNLLLPSNSLNNTLYFSTMSLKPVKSASAIKSKSC